MYIKKFNLALSACILSFLISFSAMGDDLEIYLGTGSESSTYKPNVLFIMDTSGSMRSSDGTNSSRIQKVQIALATALANATNINAGLMRFSNIGGPILYPVTDIDLPVPAEFVLPISDRNDDAHEINLGVNLSERNLVLSQGLNTVHSAFRYQNVNIPKGAVITSARLKFTSRGSDSSPTNFSIKAQAAGSAPAFSNNFGDISTRTLTSNEVTWDKNNDWPHYGIVISTPNLKSLVQEVVNGADWCGGNDLAIIMKSIDMSSSSSRRVLSSDNGDSNLPLLVISYDESTATGCIRDNGNYQIAGPRDNAEENDRGRNVVNNQLAFRDRNNAYVGLRFNQVNIPQGATITKAYLEFTASRSRSRTPAEMTIRGVNIDDSADFQSYPEYRLRDVGKTAASVPWANMGAWRSNGKYESPSINNVIQEIVNRAGWQANNNLTIVLSDFGRQGRNADSYAGSPSGAPTLVVEFQGNAEPGSSFTVRDQLISQVNELGATGLTPIVDTLYEAVLYYGGMPVDYGLQRGGPGVNQQVQQATRVSNRNSYEGLDPVRPYGCTDENLSSTECRSEYIPSGARYISPIADLQCQTNNHIVLLSDGQANGNQSIQRIQSLLGTNSCTGSSDEQCGIDLVKNIEDRDDSAIDARIVTHTIGFAADATANSFLNRLAVAGSGRFYTADDSDQLLTAFNTILNQVKDINATFVSPGVAVNQLNRLSHRDELYFALFKPADGTHWPGNLKKFKISGDQIVDKNGLNAIDSGTGFFAADAHSYWSTLTDGNDVREGGAASKLDLVRKVYFFEDAPGIIFNSAKEVNENNTNITTSDLAVDVLPNANMLRDTILKWARGVDVNDDDGDGSSTDVRAQMGDPIHSQPVIVNYSDTDSAVFIATNHGFLHSIDAEDGSENFAIIPRELLSNLNTIYDDASTYSHPYGLDGDLVLRTFGGKTYLYLGMRRGGNNYYVFDVTQKNNPKIVFTVNGGEGQFANMGQTWSRPIITKVDIGGTVKNVMIVGGGYDETQDNRQNRSDDVVGNSVFMIDADNGQLLWSAGLNNANLILDDMKYSIPARIAAIDRDKDGLADHLYVADMGGQMFRLDIYNGQSVNNLVSGGLLASFGGDTPEENRRFYYAPDVSEVLLGDQPFYAVAIGSGFRAGPLNTTINDKFYMIKDDGIFTLTDEGKFTMPSSPYLASDLYDASDHLLTSSDENEREIADKDFAEKHGWLINLTQGGEKVLSSPLILDYKVFFTTYLPAASNESLCAPPSGNSRSYLINLINGSAVTDLNNNGETENDDRFADLLQSGIAPEAKILIESIVQPVVCLGTECVSAVIQVDEDGNEIACGNKLECLAQNIYGRFERVQKDIWKTEIERP
jgi:type IV pilus assembly protein PilY1